LVNLYNLFEITKDDLQSSINETINNNLNYFKLTLPKKNESKKQFLVTVSKLILDNNQFFLLYLIDNTEWLIIEEEIKKVNKEITIANAELLDRIDHLSAVNNRLIETERYLTELNSKKDRFLWIISHDLKNYLNSIINSSKKLRFEYSKLKPSDLLENIDLINLSAESMFNLLENLIEWSNIQTGRVNVVISDYNLKELVNNIINIYNYELKRKKISLINLIPDEIYVKIDFNILNIILRNLISNSIKFTNINGLIKIYIDKESNNKITLCVEDNGIGIEDKIKHSLFNYRILNKTQGTFGEVGSGIGLILVKDLIDGIGSKIWIESDFGYGTKVYFDLYKGCKD